MFIAILDGHYTEIDEEYTFHKTRRESFISWVIFLLKDETRKIIKNLYDVF